MKSTVILFKKIFDYSELPLVFTSALVVLLYALPEAKNVAAAEPSLAFLLPSFCVFYSLKSFKKAVAAGFLVFASSLVLWAYTGKFYSLLFCAVCAFLCVKLFSGVKMQYALAAGLLCGCALSAGVGLCYEQLFSLLKSFAILFKGRGALFGVFGNAYELAVSDTFSNLFYNTAFSVSRYTEQGILSGVKAFPLSREAAQYLTGKYFVNISLSLGLFFALYKRLKGEGRAALAATCLTVVLAGDSRLLCLFAVLYNPVLYLAYLPAVFAAYLISSLLDLRIGFETSASVFELFKNINGAGYFLVTAFVLGVLMYFLARLTLSRFEIDRGRYLPRDIRRLVLALGGESNLLRFDGDVLLVKNPNLIDVLKVDCDIRQNAVTLYPDETELLKLYLC